MKKIIVTILVSILAVASVSARQFPNKKLGDIAGDGRVIYNWVKSDKAQAVTLVENGKAVEGTESWWKYQREVLAESDFKDLAKARFTGVEIEYFPSYCGDSDSNGKAEIVMIALATEFDKGKITNQVAFRATKLLGEAL